MVTIEEGAIFVADAHYPHHGNALPRLLDSIESGRVVTTQLFLMGDIFDLLIGGLEYSYILNQTIIDTINRLSNFIDIHYIEGNHDFNLHSIFPNVIIYPRASQPLFMSYNGKRVGLSHGDIYGCGVAHDIMSRVIRSRIFVTVTKPLQRCLINRQVKILAKKSISHKIDRFKELADTIIASYGETDIIVEGHLHQARIYQDYISLPSLAVHSQIGVASDKEIEFIDI